MSVEEAHGSYLPDQIYQAMQNHPQEVGEILADTEMLTSVVSYAVEGEEDKEGRNFVVDGVLYGLVFAEAFDRKTIRFPRLHRALGRIVFDDFQLLKPRKKR